MTVLDSLYIVGERTVLTYEPEGWPAGVITGYPSAGGFHVEHVVVFPGQPSTALLRMVRLGLEEAWRRGYDSVTFCVPRDFRLTRGLVRLGHRLGFEEYARDQRFVFYVCYRKGDA